MHAETPKMPYSGESKRSDTLDALRGIAILMVIAYHWLGMPLGWTGVDLFFLLSGYLISGILMDNRTSGAYYKTFYCRRLFRILPLYILFLAGAIPLFGSTIPIWNYCLFTQNFAWSHGGPLGVTSVTWSLGVEEQFYLLLPTLVRITSIRALATISILCIVLAVPCRILLVPIYGNPMAAHFLLPAKMDVLFSGVLIACIMRHPVLMVTLRRRFRSILLCGVASAASLVALAAISPKDFGSDAILWSVACSLTDLAYGCLMLGLLLANRRRLKFRALCSIGLWSYSIYLIHEPIRVSLLAMGAALHLPPMTLLPIAFGVVVAVATVCWTRIEKPLIDWARDNWSYQTNRLDAPIAATQAQ
jgi:peptidoglycan/LPS O-acetylase OafA/YrhL